MKCCVKRKFSYATDQSFLLIYLFYQSIQVIDQYIAIIVFFRYLLHILVKAYIIIL